MGWQSLDSLLLLMSVPGPCWGVSSGAGLTPPTGFWSISIVICALINRPDTSEW